jgi:hypothetical protein
MSTSSIVKKLLMVTAGAAFITLGKANAVQAASIGYITNNNPWGNITNDAAMNTAFGSGNWDRFTFSSAVSSGILSGSTYKTLFFEGSDSNGQAFTEFLNNNRNTLESWVTNGGSLFLNAARNNGYGALNLGFGVSLLSLNYSNTATAVNPNHLIFQGPNGATGASFSGNYFAHDTVIGSGLTSLINGSSGSVLAEKDYGFGHVLIGGMTTVNFHSPQPQATSLRANILSYAASKSNQASQPVPEPLTILGSGLALGFGSLMKRQHSRKLKKTGVAE